MSEKHDRPFSSAASFLAHPDRSEHEAESHGGDNANAGRAAVDRIAGGTTGWTDSHGPRRGIASFYGTSAKGDRSGDGFAGRKMANGLPMDPRALTAAHKSLPFGTVVSVRRIGSMEQVQVTVMDRGPYVAGRILDLSPAAAKELNMIDNGHATVELTIVSHGDGRYHQA